MVICAKINKWIILTNNMVDNNSQKITWKIISTCYWSTHGGGRAWRRLWGQPRRHRAPIVHMPSSTVHSSSCRKSLGGMLSSRSSWSQSFLFPCCNFPSTATQLRGKKINSRMLLLTWISWYKQIIFRRDHPFKHPTSK